MKRLLYLLLFLAPGPWPLAPQLYAQGTTCQQQTNFTSATNSTTLDNRLRVLSPACDVWRLDYYSSGLSALSIAVQGAPDSNGAAGTWVDIASTAVMYGSNPSTGLQGQILLRSYYPWMRVNVTTFTTTGTIYATLSGVNALSLAPPVTASIAGTVAATQSGAWVVGQSGTWTVQPGNTANTTAWKVDGSAVTQPISGTVAATQSGSWTVTVTSSDPCLTNTKTILPISLTTNTEILNGTASNKTYICSIDLVAGAATNVALVEGTGTVCATNIVALTGGTTAATGWNFAANGGIAKGSGAGTIFKTTVNDNNVCILVSAANQVSGSIAYVTAP